MISWIRNLLSTPTNEHDEYQRSTRLLRTTLTTIFFLSLVVPALLSILEPENTLVNLLSGLGGVFIVSILWILQRYGRARLASMILLGFLIIVFTAGIYQFNGIRSTALTGYIFIILMAGLLIDEEAAIVVAILSATLTLAIYFLEQQGVVQYTIREGSFTDWLQFVIMLVLTVLPLRFSIRSISEGFERARQDEEILRERNLELEAIRSNLVKRTEELEHRTHYLEATAEVAREAASILDFNELAREVVYMISDRFGFYHAGLFLVDERGEWAVLEAASSHGGQNMLARGHRLRVGEEGIVGYVTGQGEARVALDVGEDAVYFDNPDMPETRSEMALPLMARGEIIGALDVQSKKPQAFSSEDIAVLQTMATQIALAISNARLFQRVQAIADAERRAYGQISHKDWQRIVQSRSRFGYRYEQGDIYPLNEPATLHAEEDLPKIEIPIRVRGQVIGTINAHKASPDESWSEEENKMMSTLAQQMGEALESARLYENTQQRAMREQMLSEATDKMRRAGDIDALMKTAVQEMANILGTSNAFVQFTGQNSDSEPSKERKSQ